MNTLNGNGQHKNPLTPEEALEVRIKRYRELGYLGSAPAQQPAKYPIWAGIQKLLVYGLITIGILHFINYLTDPKYRHDSQEMALEMYGPGRPPNAED